MKEVLVPFRLFDCFGFVTPSSPFTFAMGCFCGRVGTALRFCPVFGNIVVDCIAGEARKADGEGMEIVSIET